MMDMKKAHKGRSMVRPQQVDKDTYSTNISIWKIRKKNIENYHTELQYI